MPGSDDTIRVSVVVPFRDAVVHLPTLLQALAAQRFPADGVEYLFVDNGSGDAGPDIVGDALAAGDLPGRLLACPEPASSYAARNVGAAAARGAILAFTDADCRPAPGWLAAIADHLEDPAHADDVVAGAVDLQVRDPRNPWELFDHAVHLDNAREAAKARVATANMAVRRDVFAAVGPFVELSSGADHLWSGRASEHGHPVVHVPAVRVDHPTRSTRTAVVTKLVRTARGQGEAAARDPRLRLRHTVRALLRPLLVHRHLQVARTDAAAGGVPVRVRLFLLSTWLRARQIPPYFAALREKGPVEASGDPERTR